MNIYFFFFFKHLDDMFNFYKILLDKLGKIFSQFFVGNTLLPQSLVHNAQSQFWSLIEES